MGFRKSRAAAVQDADDALEALRAQAAVAMQRARRMASEDPIERARAIAETKAEHAALFATGQRTPSIVGWFRGPGDPEQIERYWDGVAWTELTRDLSAPVPVPDVLPFAGELVWLTPQQGGLPDGPPQLSADRALSAQAFVPPAIAEAGVTPFVLRGQTNGSAGWRTSATAGWLTVDGSGPRRRRGSVVGLAEQITPIGYFTVTAVLDRDADCEDQAPEACRDAGATSFFTVRPS
jgi:hypothetical protein